MAEGSSSNSSRQAQSISTSRLSIYDSPGAPILLVPEAPTALQLQISSVRKAAQSVYSDLSQRARLASDQWIGAEHKLERLIADELSTLRAKDEPLTPGGFYVGISTLLGSIMTRNRLLPLRIMTPPTFLIASTAYFLPKHFTNTTTYITALEKTYTPELYSWQSQCLSTLYRVRKSALEIVGRGTQETQDASSRVWRWVYAQAGAGQKQRSQSQSDIDR